MAKPPGAPLGLAIAGLGMAGAVMVRAAAVHPGVKLVALVSRRLDTGRRALS